MPSDFKGTVFQKNLVGGYVLAQNEQFINQIFWISLKPKLLYVYTETTLNGEYSISVNNNINFKKIQMLSIQTIQDGLRQKTISRYCPFNGCGNAKDPHLWQRPAVDQLESSEYSRTTFRRKTVGGGGGAGGQPLITNID